MQSYLRCWIGCLFAVFLLTACGSSAQGDLDDASELALEIGIVSTLAGSNALFPVQISDSLQNRLEKVGNVQMRKSSYGMISAGRMKSEDGGRLMTIEISSPVSASIDVRDGEIGLQDGDIYIGEGTKLTNADGKTFTFVRGKWSAKANKSAKSKTDTIRRVTINVSQRHLEAMGLSNNAVSSLMLAASELCADYKDSKSNIDELITKLEMLPIEGADIPDNVRLGDIAKVSADLTERGPKDTSDIKLVLGATEE